MTKKAYRTVYSRNFWAQTGGKYDDNQCEHIPASIDKYDLKKASEARAVRDKLLKYYREVDREYRSRSDSITRLDEHFRRCRNDRRV